MKDDHNSIPDFPNISLMAKILIDDGTFEAVVWLYNTKAKELFKISDNTLNLIRTQVLMSTNVMIYDKYSNKGFLTKDCFENIFVNKYVGYFTPYSNVIKKAVVDTNYTTLFKNLVMSEDNMKQKAATLVFINGDVSYENFNITNEYYLQPRPLLKMVNFDLVE